MRTRMRGGATVVLLASLLAAGCGPAAGRAGSGGAPTTIAGTSAAAGPTPGAWPNASAQPVKQVLRTGIRIGDDELLLSPARDHIVDLAWFDTRTGRYHGLPEDENFRSALGGDRALPFFEVRERPGPDGRLITYGFASTPVARATIAQPGYPTTTLALAQWGGDDPSTLFWAARPGRPLTAEVPTDQRAVCTLYDAAGRVIARLVLAETRYENKGG
ncbi:hypothetical protein ABZV78_01765 [Micromonospora sp. NPDC004540]|uniref:hypothetical protein n=1 Tax=Micromonospora sp. NPDC004540 TaxID=3154457 RepID=UPI0033A7E8B8